MALNISTATAVELHKVEKQAQTLTGDARPAPLPRAGAFGRPALQLAAAYPARRGARLLQKLDLPVELRLDLLQVAFDADHGLLWLYAPAHLAVPRAARTDER